MSDPFLPAIYSRLLALLDTILVLRERDPNYEKLSLQEELAMDVIARRGSLSMSELAHLLGLLPNTLTGVVNRLVRWQVVKREQSPKDRRVVLVRLTARGTRMYRKHQAFVFEHIGRMLEVLQDAEKTAFIGLLDRISAQLQSE